MTSGPAVYRSILIYGICLPLAVFLGYLMATPEDFSTFTFVAVVLAILALPVMLRWHYPLMVVTLNTTAVAFFIKGGPQLWLLMVMVSLSVALLQRAVNQGMRFVLVPQIVWSMIFLTLVVLITAKFT